GAGPTALIQGKDGNFYGVTIDQGPGGRGTVFQLTPSGTLTTLHAFTGQDGWGQGRLIEGSDGNLYGSKLLGGPGFSANSSNVGNGTVFKLTVSGTFTLLYGFAGRNSAEQTRDGLQPASVIQA